MARPPGGRRRRLIRPALGLRGGLPGAASDAPGPAPALRSTGRPRRRDRHGRGLRGPLAPAGSPLSRTRAEQFDDLVADAVERVLRRWSEPLTGVDFVVEDVPQLEDWPHDWVPLSRSFPAERATPARIVVYRRAVQARTRDAGEDELRRLVEDVVVDEVAELLGVDPERVDPDVDPDG